MNKNFPDSDEDDSLITTESFGGKTVNEKEFADFAAPFSKIEDEPDLSEVYEPTISAAEISDKRETAEESVDLEEKNAPIVQSAEQNSNFKPFIEEKTEAVNFGFDDAENSAKKNDDLPIFTQSPYHSESSDETIRKSGLAYTAAIILLASIVFTLILGWFADLLFGTSPWGKVGGIVLGSIIGFVQFFRTTSQLVRNKD